MKNLKILLILSLTITLFSCKKSDDGAEASSSALVGTWKLTALTGTSSGTAVDSSTMMSIPVTGVQTGKNMNATVVFTENPNNATGSGTYDFDVVFTATGTTATQTVTQTGLKLVSTNPATWTLVGSTLTLIDGSDTNVATVTINGNTMTAVVTSPLNYVDGTVTTTGTGTTTQTFTKQ